MNKSMRVMLAGLVAASALSIAPAANARGGDEVRRAGNCSGATDWKLKLKKDDGRIETEFEVDQNIVGARWRVTLKHDGVRFFRAVRTTKAPSGSFEVRQRVRNHRGPDVIRAKAHNLRTDEVCRGRAKI